MLKDFEKEDYTTYMKREKLFLLILPSLIKENPPKTSIRVQVLYCVKKTGISGNNL